MAWNKFRGSPKSELERLKEEDAAAPRAAAPPTWRGESNVVTLPVRPAEVRKSGFDIPQRVDLPAAGPMTVADLAAGVEVMQGSGAGGQGQEEQLFATPWERYEHLLIQKARGITLSPEEDGFMSWFRLEYQEMLAIAGAQLEQRVRLAVVE
jgi:hypothetical protein